MNNYELTIILAGGATAAKKKSTQASIEKIVKTFKGTLGKVDDWGDKDLFHKIKGSETGTFLHFQLELDTQSAKQISSKLNFEADVLRYLLVRKSKEIKN